MALMSNKTKPIPGIMYFEILFFMVFIIPRQICAIGGQFLREFGRIFWFELPEIHGFNYSFILTNKRIDLENQISRNGENHHRPNSRHKIVWSLRFRHNYNLILALLE
jgi:hypothetical protein